MPIVEAVLRPYPDVSGVNIGDVTARQGGFFTFDPSQTTGKLGKGSETTMGERPLFLCYNLASIPTTATLIDFKFSVYTPSGPVSDLGGGKFRVGILVPDSKWDANPGFQNGAGPTEYAVTAGLPHPTSTASDAIIAGRLVLDTFLATTPAISFSQFVATKFGAGETTTIGTSGYSPDFQFGAAALTLMQLLVLNSGTGNPLYPTERVTGWVFDPYQVPSGTIQEYITVRHEDSGLQQGVLLTLKYSIPDSDRVCTTGVSTDPAVATSGLKSATAVETSGAWTSESVYSVSISGQAAVRTTWEAAAPAVKIVRASVEEC